MGFNFPDAPTIGQVHPPYEWDGEKWFLQIKPGKGDALVTVGDTPPPSPSDGQFWWNSATGVLFFWFNDGTSSQWVVASPVPDISMIVTQSYVDAADAALLTHVDEADAAALVHVDAADAAAKTYTDTQDAALKTYVDAADVAAKSYTDAGDAAAKAYTDSQDAVLAGLIGASVLYSPQSLTAPQQEQARNNISASPSGWMKQYVINGAMMVSAENGATAGTVVPYYPVDMFWGEIGGGGAFSIAQVASPTPGGSPNRVRLTITTAAALAVGDYGAITQGLEGLRTLDLRFGSVSAKAITLRWGCRGPAGTYCVVLSNGNLTRSFVSEFTILPGEANTDIVRRTTIPGDQAGVWAIDNTRGMQLRWCVRCGSNYAQAPGTWGTLNSVGSPNQFNLFGTAGNVFELFDVAMYAGTTAPSEYTVPDVVIEKHLCRRYFQYQTTSSAMWLHPIESSANYRRRWYEFHPEMRAPPVVTMASVSNGTATATANQITSLNCELSGDSSGLGVYVYLQWLKAMSRI